jgi:diamine N-acetyltransferase
MQIIELPISEVSKIKPLWELLNKTHYENSNNWKRHFIEQTFEERFQKLQDVKYAYILVAKIDSEIVAYCFSIANESSGEIASIYVKNQYRSMKIGKKLISTSIDWMKKKGIAKVIVGVAEGNENVFQFYEKLGFKKSATVLKLTQDK